MSDKLGYTQDGMVFMLVLTDVDIKKLREFPEEIDTYPIQVTITWEPSLAKRIGEGLVGASIEAQKLRDRLMQ